MTDAYHLCCSGQGIKAFRVWAYSPVSASASSDTGQLLSYASITLIARLAVVCSDGSVTADISAGYRPTNMTGIPRTCTFNFSAASMMEEQVDSDTGQVIYSRYAALLLEEQRSIGLLSYLRV